MNEYRIKVIVRNHLLLSAIEAAGYKTVAAFCRDNDLIESQVNALCAMRERPIRSTGEFSKTAKSIMEALGAAPSDLWSEEQLYLKLETNSAERAVSRADIHHFLEAEKTAWTIPSPEDEIIRAESAAVIGQLLQTLKPAQKQVIEERFREEKTLEETAQSLGVTRERVRQIEAKALRTLRNEQNKKIILENC